MKCKLCGHDLTSEDDEDDNMEFDREVLEACNNNSSHIVNTIEYLLICLDCKHETPYGYLWFAICDGREHVLTSEHKQVTITEIFWQNNKALEILRIEIINDCIAAAMPTK